MKEIGYSQHGEEYTEVKYGYKVCTRCDLLVYYADSHGIEDCVRSLADRVKKLFEEKKCPSTK
jgi:hypothetical protein